MKTTLLERAHKIKRAIHPKSKSFTDEEIELAIAYVKGEVTERQAQEVTTGKQRGYQWKATQILLYASREKRLKISIIKSKQK